MEALWDHVGVSLGSCWDHFGIILGSLWSHARDILEWFWITLKLFWNHYWDKFGLILGSEPKSNLGNRTTNLVIKSVLVTWNTSLVYQNPKFIYQNWNFVYQNLNFVYQNWNLIHKTFNFTHQNSILWQNLYFGLAIWILVNQFWILVNQFKILVNQKYDQKLKLLMKLPILNFSQAFFLYYVTLLIQNIYSESHNDTKNYRKFQFCGLQNVN